MLCIDQNLIQVCQLEFFKIWRMWIKRTLKYEPKRKHLKVAKKNWTPCYFSTFWVSILVNRSFLGWFRFIGRLMLDNIYFPVLNKKCVIWWRFAGYEDFLSHGAWCGAFPNMQAQQHIFPDFPVGKSSWF